MSQGLRDVCCGYLKLEISSLYYFLQHNLNKSADQQPFRSFEQEIQYLLLILNEMEQSTVSHTEVITCMKRVQRIKLILVIKISCHNSSLTH